MDTGTLVQRVESVERNIAFLKKEHQVLLTGLCLEINHLKKRCDDLNSELNKRPLGRNTEDKAADEELLQAQLLQIEAHLADQECLQGELKAKLRHKCEQGSTLQARLRDEERRFLEELKRRSHKITALSRDLRKRTDVAAQLAFQLHSTRFHLHHQAGQEEKKEDDNEEESHEPSCSASSHYASAVRAEARYYRPSSSRIRRMERARECVPQERVLGPEEPRTMPDPGLFLYPFRQRLLPLHISLREHYREGGLSESSGGQMVRPRARSIREDTEPETTEL